MAKGKKGKKNKKQWNADLGIENEWSRVENAIRRTGMRTRPEFLLFVTDVIEAGVLDEIATNYRIGLGKE